MKNEFDENNPIAKAVEPLRKEAVTRAKQYAARTVRNLLLELKVNGWNRQAVAPYPQQSTDYFTRLAKYRLACLITKSVESCWKPGQPVIVKLSAEGIARLMKTTAEEASEQYDNFIAKLVNKIGACQHATLKGSHVWSFSTLTVIKDGARTIEYWQTQQIVNISKLGKVFNQWPTRRIKK